jgi:ribosome maturation protein Sdo1
MSPTKPQPKQSSDSPPLSREVIKARREAIDAELDAVRMQRQTVDRVLAEVSHKAELALLKAELQTELASTHADRAEMAANQARRYAQRCEAAKPDYLALLLITVGISGLVATSLILLYRPFHEPTQPISQSAAATSR